VRSTTWRRRGAASTNGDCRRDAKLVVLVQLSLIPLFGLYYPVVVAALIAANVLSNLREMAEHGLDGQGAYVNIRVSRWAF